MTQLLTVGHGRLDRAGLGALLRQAGVEALVDVRRYPGSRNNPDVARDALGEWLPQCSVDYRWEPRLGGRRRLTKDEDAQSPDAWWTVAAFRAYAAYTRTAEFTAGLDQLVAQAAGQRVAVMCSESVWWRCHRRLIADVAALGRGLHVLDLMHDGRQLPHRVADGARVRDDGQLVWSGSTEGGR